MANSYTQIQIHIVFAVKYRESLISKEWREELYKYTSAIITSEGHKTLAVGGTDDHIHIFIGYKPSRSLSYLVMVIKRETSEWINKKRFCRKQFRWQEGFGAFSHSSDKIKTVVRYVLNQEEHHAKSPFRDEYLNLLRKNEVDYDERYIFSEPQ